MRNFVIRNLKLVIWFLVFGNVILAQDSTFFGNINVDSDSVIVSLQLDNFLNDYSRKSFDELNYNLFTEQLMQFPVQQGFLFPNLTLRKIDPTTQSDSLFMNPSFNLHFGEIIVIDTLIFKDLEKTSYKLLYKDLKFLYHRKYESEVNNILKQRLKKYSFLSCSGESEVIKTHDGKFGLLVSLQEQQSNSFSGVVGYVPKTANRDGYFTGLLDIDLKNINGMGRGFKIYWSKVNENSQELTLNYFEPHLLGSQFFTNIGFNQTLRDTLLVIRNFNFGLGNDMSQHGTIEITGTYESTLPTPPGREILQLTKNKIFKAGLRYIFDNRDLVTNPTQGFLFNAHNYLGSHEKDGKQKILTQSEINAELNISLPQKLVINLNSFYKAKFIKESKLDYSDLFWFGGATSLRGYPEDFFSGNEIGSFGAELRWITGYYSRIFVFFDQGYYKTPDNEINLPNSFGIGMRLESRMGTIGLDYAFGEDDTFTTAKIHLHLKNRF